MKNNRSDGLNINHIFSKFQQNCDLRIISRYPSSEGGNPRILIAFERRRATRGQFSLLHEWRRQITFENASALRLMQMELSRSLCSGGRRCVKALSWYHDCY